MKQRKKKTLFKKLTLSYFLIITLMALILSVTIVTVASSHYSREMQKLNSMALEQAAGIVSSNVLTPVNRAMIALSLGTDYKVRLDDLKGGEALAKVATLCTGLNNTLSSSQGMLEGLHIYFKKADFIASSTMGYLQNTAVNRRLWPDMRWFEEITAFPDGGAHHFLRTLKHHATAEPIAVITFVIPHPVTLPFRQAHALIAADVPLTYLSRVLDSVSGADGQVLQLFDGAGRFIMGNSEGPASEDVSAMGYGSNKACAAAEGEGVFVTSGNSHMLRSSVLLPNGWLIVSHVPVNTFFAVNRTISVFTLLITLCTVLLFMLISGLFARRFYTPVERLMARARLLLDRMEWGNESKDEFAQVDTVLTEMETKLLAISRDWEDNLPTLKLAFMRSITEGEIISQQSFDRQLRYHARSMADAQYRIMLAFISPNVEDGPVQPVNDMLINYIEHQSAKDIAYIAYERGEDCICVLVLSSGGLARSRVSGIISYARRVLSVDISIAVGTACSSPADIRLSFKQALQAYGNSYFEEWNNLFIDVPMSEPEGALREMLMKDLEAYRDILDKGDRDELETHLQVSMEHIASARISPDAKHSLLAGYITALNERIRKDDERFSSAQTSRNFPGISAFGTWLFQASSLLLSDRSGENRGKEVVDSVVSYIHANLAQELSLTRLSEHTMLSNNYLSRLFKEHTGINLVDYITRSRMSKAAEMLTGTKLSVEQIARALGYNTPHYFSKRFRENFGLTPNQYRLCKAGRLVNNSEQEYNLSNEPE